MLAMMPMMLFTACSDDDDTVIDSPVVGTWKTSDTYGTSTITFKSNGTVFSKDVFRDDVFEDAGTYTVEGNKIIIYWQGDDEATVLVFTISGNTMRTYMEGETGYTDWTRV